MEFAYTPHHCTTLLHIHGVDVARFLRFSFHSSVVFFCSISFFIFRCYSLVAPHSQIYVDRRLQVQSYSVPNMAIKRGARRTMYTIHTTDCTQSLILSLPHKHYHRAHHAKSITYYTFILRNSNTESLLNFQRDIHSTARIQSWTDPASDTWTFAAHTHTEHIFLFLRLCRRTVSRDYSTFDIYFTVGCRVGCPGQGSVFHECWTRGMKKKIFFDKFKRINMIIYALKGDFKIQMLTRIQNALGKTIWTHIVYGNATA